MSTQLTTKKRPAGSLLRIFEKQRKSSNIHKIKHVLSLTLVHIFLLSLFKHTLISSLNYSDSSFYFMTWDEKTNVRAVIRAVRQLFPTRVDVAIWSRSNGCSPMPRDRLVSGT